MKNLFITLLIISFQQINAQEILNNQSVIDLVELGFESDVIISKIKTTDCNFNTEMEDLMELKEKNVPSNVIAAMIEFGKSVIEVGVFIKTNEEIKKIEPNSFTSNSSDFVASAFTMGIAGSKTKAKLDNVTSINTSTVNSSISFFIRNYSLIVVENSKDYNFLKRGKNNILI